MAAQGRLWMRTTALPRPAHDKVSALRLDMAWPDWTADQRASCSYVNFAMRKVNMLRYHGVTPLIVFDGGHLPAKSKTEEERERCAGAAPVCHSHPALTCPSPHSHTDVEEKTLDRQRRFSHRVVLSRRASTLSSVWMSHLRWHIS